MTEVFISQDLGELQGKIAGLPANVTRKVMRDIAALAEREAMRRYQRTTSSWDHRPQFESATDYTATTVSALIGTDDPIYRYVDRGTKAHTIAPKGPGYPLRFRSGYQAKTRPGVLGSGPGGASGSWVRAMSVWHPGTKPRGFTAMIFREVDSLVSKKMLEMLHKVLRGYLPISVGRRR